VFTALLSSYQRPAGGTEVRDLLKLLFDRSLNKKITELMITAVGSSGELEFLLSRGLDFSITEGMLKSAALKR
jgi:hypothetical protein